VEEVTVKLLEHDAPPSGLADAARSGLAAAPSGLAEAAPSAWAEAAWPATTPLGEVTGFIKKTLVIAEMEARKLMHDPTEVLTRSVQPALWLLIFGQVFTRLHAIPTGGMTYIEFMAPGILAQSVLFISIFYGIAVIWERDLGILHKFLASPTPRTALVLGKALSAGVRALTLVVIIYLLAVVMGVHMNWNPLAMLGVLVTALLGAAFFATLSLIIACLVKSRDRFMGIGQVLTMPLFFASNAIYPIEIMPGWLQAISHANPLTYEVDALRAMMLAQGTSTFGLGLDFLVLVGATTVLVIIAGKLYPSVAV
jgi:ABC-2 type transport system permease protein